MTNEDRELTPYENFLVELVYNFDMIHQLKEKIENIEDYVEWQYFNELPLWDAEIYDLLENYVDTNFISFQ